MEADGGSFKSVITFVGLRSSWEETKEELQRSRFDEDASKGAIYRAIKLKLLLHVFPYTCIHV